MTRIDRHRPNWYALHSAAILLVGGVLVCGQFGCAVPLLNAAASGDTKIVLVLLQEGHDVNKGFPFVGTRPLMLAAAYGHAETARVLLDAGADVNAEDLTGWTALHAGAFRGDPATVSLLLERGAFPRTTHWFLESPLSIAETLGHKELLPLLRGIEPCNLVSPPMTSTSR